MPLLILAIAFGVAILLNRRGLMLGAALIIGALLVLVFKGFHDNIISALVETVSDVTTVDLLISVNLIQVLVLMLEGEGVLRRLVGRLFALLGNSKNIMFLVPILTALIPGPGVVLLSAPIIEEASRMDSLGGTEKSFINFWFRAAVQVSSPLTFAFILVTGIISVNKGYLFLGLLPFTVVMLLSGYWFQLKGIPCRQIKIQRNMKNWVAVTKDLVFIWIVLFLYLILDLPFSVGVATAIGWVFLTERPSMSQAKKYLRQGISLESTILILGIMFFKSVVDISGLMEAVIGWFISLGAPLMMPVIMLPLLIGLVIGNYAGAVALTFAFLGAVLQGIPFWVAINVITRIGCLLSPVNSSRLLTINYFSGDDNRLRLKVLLALSPVVVLVVLYLILVG